MGKRLASHLRPLDSREEKLDALLEYYPEATQTLRGPSDTRGGSPGSRALAMPRIWQDCYEELDRCLGKMFVLAETPGLASPQFHGWYTNLSSWYFQVEPRRDPDMRRSKSGRMYHYAREGRSQFLLHVHERTCRNPGCKGCRGGDPSRVMGALSWLSLDYPGEVKALILNAA